jgi:hypothetical protein
MSLLTPITVTVTNSEGIAWEVVELLCLREFFAIVSLKDLDGGSAGEIHGFLIDADLSETLKLTVRVGFDTIDIPVGRIGTIEVPC